jgi:hypothetical protein
LRFGKNPCSTDVLCEERTFAASCNMFRGSYSSWIASTNL